MSTHREALIKAIEIAGGQRALARKLSEETGEEVSQAAVWGWLNKAKKFPPEMCGPIERVCEGRVSKHEFRPDLFESAQSA